MDFPLFRIEDTRTLAQQEGQRIKQRVFTKLREFVMALTWTWGSLLMDNMSVRSVVDAERYLLRVSAKTLMNTVRRALVVS